MPLSNESQIVFLIWRRIVVTLIALMFFAYLDRVNVAFAALRMNAALGLTGAQFGFAAGIFALGYAAAGIPSTIMLERVGARRWLALTTALWGLCSTASAFVTGPRELYTIRFLLGIAEAGLAPGTVLYASGWFPKEYRGRVFGGYFLVLPISQLAAGPLCSALLGASGALGLAGWQWIFVAEGLPSLALAVVVLGLLTESPAHAHWLSAQQQEWLLAKLAREQADRPVLSAAPAHWQALRNPRVWLLAVVCLLQSTAGIGILIFLPLIIHSTGFSARATGIMATIPAAAAAACLPLWGIWADRAKSREPVAATACAVMASGLMGTAMLLPSPWAVLPICLAFMGFFGGLAPFWTLPSAFLTGAGAAVGISLITLTGNMGQLVGPYVLGRLADVSHSYSTGLTILAGFAALAAVVLSLSTFQRAARVSVRYTS